MSNPCRNTQAFFTVSVTTFQGKGVPALTLPFTKQSMAVPIVAFKKLTNSPKKHV
jgi:hypothetical protein